MFKFNKTNESGRSMVEMLGVLAIIGVLSVMGIAGYTQAMKSYKANEIVNATSMLYMMGVSANGGQGVTQDLTYAAAFDKTLPDGVSTLTYKADGSIELTIADETIRSRVSNIMGSKATGTEGSTTLSIAMNTGTGETNTPTTPTVTPTDCKTKSECEAHNFAWLQAIGSMSSLAGCYPSPTEAQAACDAANGTFDLNSVACMD